MPEEKPWDGLERRECMHHEKIDSKQQANCKKIGEVVEKLDGKVSLTSLIGVITIVLVMFSGVVSILHYGYSTTITELKVADKDFLKLMEKQSDLTSAQNKETNDTLFKIQLSIVRLENAVAGLKTRKEMNK